MKNMLLALVLFLPVQAHCSEPAATDQEAADDLLPLFEEADFIEVYDPLEPLNRAIFHFNDAVYFSVTKPLARAWRHAPEPLRISIRNLFDNLRAPVRVVNATLQGKFHAAGSELTRFATNSTIGIAGLFDPARDHFNLQPVNEDTGQTLGFYGVGPGPYLVLPFLGPSSLRDGVALYGDTYLDLAWYLWGDHKADDNYDYLGARTAEVIDRLSLDRDTYEGIKRDALDPYLYMRDAWAQYRRNQVDN